MSFSRWHLCCAARGRLTSSVVASARVVLVALMALTSIPTTRAAETLRDALAAALASFGYTLRALHLVARA